MQVAKNAVVSFHFSLSDAESGETLETSEGQAPRVYLHGHGGLLPALERALEGGVVGESRTVEVAPREGYGERREDQLQRVPVKQLQFKGKLRAGDLVGMRTADGHTQPVTVVKVGKFAADVDCNHPYAGRHLRFLITVEALRAAAPEEIAHGHVHGAGGHHH